MSDSERGSFALASWSWIGLKLPRSSQWIAATGCELVQKRKELEMPKKTEKSTISKGAKKPDAISDKDLDKAAGGTIFRVDPYRGGTENQASKHIVNKPPTVIDV